MYKHVIILLLFFVFIVPASPGLAKKAVDPAPKAYFVVNTATGSIAKEKNADLPIPPASLTKILTMYIVLDAIEQGEIHFHDQVKISAAACKAGGTTMRLEPFTEVELIDLVWGMAIVSANDAAVALAEHISGSAAAFVRRMNQQAKRLGMKNTTFINPNGMPGQGGFTTARDMAILAHSYIFRFPWSLTAIHSQTSFTFNDITSPNRNRLLGKYPEVDGLKTGFTSASGYHIIVTAMKETERYIIVVMGAGTHTKRNEEASLLLNEVLEKPTPVVTIEILDPPDEIVLPLVTGKEKISTNKKGR